MKSAFPIAKECLPTGFARVREAAVDVSYGGTK